MNKIWVLFRGAMSILGGALSWLFGGLDYLFIILIVFIIVDYITGFINAAVHKKLSSETGWKGIAKKAVIILIIAMGHLIDMLMNTPGVIRSALIFFYAANEGLSIVENAASLGLPVPKLVKKVLAQIKDKGDDEREEKEGSETDEQKQVEELR